jgi:hypothetical protein
MVKFEYPGIYEYNFCEGSEIHVSKSIPNPSPRHQTCYASSQNEFYFLLVYTISPNSPYTASIDFFVLIDYFGKSLERYRRSSSILSVLVSILMMPVFFPGSILFRRPWASADRGIYPWYFLRRV